MAESAFNPGYPETVLPCLPVFEHMDVPATLLLHVPPLQEPSLCIGTNNERTGTSGLHIQDTDGQNPGAEEPACIPLTASVARSVYVMHTSPRCALRCARRAVPLYQTQPSHFQRSMPIAIL